MQEMKQIDALIELQKLMTFLEYEKSTNNALIEVHTGISGLITLLALANKPAQKEAFARMYQNKVVARLNLIPLELIPAHISMSELTAVLSDIAQFNALAARKEIKGKDAGELKKFFVISDTNAIATPSPKDDKNTGRKLGLSMENVFQSTVSESAPSTAEVNARYLARLAEGMTLHDTPAAQAAARRNQRGEQAAQVSGIPGDSRGQWFGDSNLGSKLMFKSSFDAFSDKHIEALATHNEDLHGSYISVRDQMLEMIHQGELPTMMPRIVNSRVVFTDIPERSRQVFIALRYLVGEAIQRHQLVLDVQPLAEPAVASEITPQNIEDFLRRYFNSDANHFAQDITQFVLARAPALSQAIHQRILEDSRTENPFEDLREQEAGYRDALHQSRNGL